MKPALLIQFKRSRNSHSYRKVCDPNFSCYVKIGKHGCDNGSDDDVIYSFNIGVRMSEYMWEYISEELDIGMLERSVEITEDEMLPEDYEGW